MRATLAGCLLLASCTSWPGSYQSENGTNAGGPPDPTVAVGPVDVVEAVNTSIKVWLKADPAGHPFRLAGVYPWPGHAAGCGDAYSDPKIVYRDHYYMATLRLSNSWCLAASESNFAQSIWRAWIIPTGFGFPDQPSIAVNEETIVLTGDTGGGTVIVVVNRADVDAGVPEPRYVTLAPSVAWLYRAVVPLVDAPTNQRAGGGPPLGAPMQYLVAYKSDELPTSRVRVGFVRGLPGETGVVVAFYNYNVPHARGLPPSGRQANTITLDTQDHRVLTTAYRFGSFWIASGGNCRPPGDSTDRSCGFLTQFNVLNTPWDGPAPYIDVVREHVLGAYGADVLFPAATIDDYGNLIAWFGLTSPLLTPSLYAGGAFAYAPNTQVPWTRVAHSATVYYPLARPCVEDGTCRCCTRWGDYQGVVPGYGDGLGTVWGVGEVVRAANGSQWDTMLAKFSYRDASSAGALAPAVFPPADAVRLAAPFDPGDAEGPVTPSAVQLATFVGMADLRP